MSDYGPRSTYTTDADETGSSAWEPYSSGAGEGKGHPEGATNRAVGNQLQHNTLKRGTPPPAPTAAVGGAAIDNTNSRSRNNDDGGWSNVRWSKPNNRGSVAAPTANPTAGQMNARPSSGIESDGNSNDPDATTNMINASSVTGTGAGAASPAPFQPTGPDGKPLPALPPPSDPFWATVPQPPPWLLAALPFMMQQQQQGGGGGIPPSFVPLNSLPMGLPPTPTPGLNNRAADGYPAAPGRSASSGSQSRQNGQYHAQMRHQPGPVDYSGDEGVPLPGRPRITRSSSAQRGEGFNATAAGYYSSDPEREDDERMYEYRENSPSSREKRNLRHLTADASQHFQELHRSRTPPAARRGARSRTGQYLTPEELRRLQKEKAERINSRRSNVEIERQRLLNQQQQQRRKLSPNASARGRPNLSGVNNSAFPGPQPKRSSSATARGPSPTPIHGRSEIVGKVGPTRRDLVGQKPRLEDALRNGVKPRYNRKHQQQGEPERNFDPVMDGILGGVNSSATTGLNYSRATNREERLATEEAMRDATTAPPQQEYVKGVEDLYQRLRTAYTQVQKDPARYLQTASLHATTQGLINPTSQQHNQHFDPNSSTLPGGVNTTLNVNRSGFSSAGAEGGGKSFQAANFSLSQHLGDASSSPNMQTKTLVDELDKLEQQWQQLTNLQERNRGDSKEGSPAGGAEDQSYLSTLPRRQPPPVQGADPLSQTNTSLQTKEGVLQRLHSTTSTGNQSGVSGGGLDRTSRQPSGGLSFSTEQVLERVRARARQRSQSMSGHQ